MRNTKKRTHESIVPKQLSIERECYVAFRLLPSFIDINTSRNKKVHVGHARGP